jgi:serine/threonine protein kinase
MISVTQNRYTPYDEILESNSPAEIPDVVVYPGIFSGDISKKIVPKLKKVHSIVRFYKNIPIPYLRVLGAGVTKLTGLPFDSCVINGHPRFNKGVIASLLFQSFTVHFKRKSDGKNVSLECPKGTLIILRENFKEYWHYMYPRHLSVTFFQSDILPLEDIYLTQTYRNHLLQVVRDKLIDVKKRPLGKQCVNKILSLDQLLGKGDYGNVYLANMGEFQFAVKLSKLKPGAIDNPYSRYNASWYEVLIMQDILRPLIQDKICPNLPLLIDSLVCNNCTITIRDVTEDQPCVTTITELANGSLRDFLKFHNPTPEELYSALFQIMAGLHAIQLHGQIMNFDVKADNVLFYNVTPGGYWLYIVHGQKYYVPNFGKLFILNDFGISRPMSPDFQLYRQPTDVTFRLGSRFAMVKNGKFSPINAYKEPDYKGRMVKSSIVHWNSTTSRGAQFRLLRETQEVVDNDTMFSKEQIVFLKNEGLTADPLEKDFFLHPEVIPPFEFYNDLQDAIRTFIGGKRTTQKGNHKRYPPVTNTLFKQLSKYNGKGESMADLKFSRDPSQVLAGYFISKFFGKDHSYRKKLSGKMHGKYVMS